MDLSAILVTATGPWAVGGALVALHAYTRFNTPPTSRSSTTWGRYHTWALAYTGAIVGVWLLAARTPDLVEFLANSAAMASQTKKLAGPLYAALVLTVATSGVKPIREQDERLRAFLQDLARIPWEAVRLSAVMRKHAWAPTDEAREAIADKLREDDLNEHDIVFDGDSVQAVWTRLTGLYLHLGGWPERPRFGGFVNNHRRELDEIDRRYDDLSGAAKRLFRLLATLRPLSGEAKLGAAADELERSFVASAQELQKAMCNLISRGLLKCALTEGSRRAELRVLGFQPPAADRFFDQLIALFIGLGIGYAAVVTVFGRPDAKIHERLISGLIIAAIYVAAVFAAIVFKRWEFGRRSDAGRPVRAYVTSALLAGALSLLASVALGLVDRGGDLSVVLRRIADSRWPWTLLAMVTGFTTAYNADNTPRPGLRWLEGLSQAGVGVVTSVVVLILLDQLCKATASPTCFVPKWAPVIVSDALACGAIGALVPTWYRERWAQALRDNDLM